MDLPPHARAVPTRQAIWLLGPPQKVRDSYIADVIDA
jgi:hypothetical protein